MKALYYWIIVFVFVLFTTVIGLFMFPFIHWLSNFSELYVVLLSLGGVLLILSIIFFRLRRKNEYKLSAMIAFPFALTFLIGGGIHYARFRSNTHSIANCLKYYGDLYSKFGVHITYSPYRRDWIVGWLNGETVILNLHYFDNHYDYQRHIVTYTVNIYDKNGDYYDSINGEFYYIQDDSSSAEYKYEFYETISGVEHSSTFDRYSFIRDEIIAQSGNQLRF